MCLSRADNEQYNCWVEGLQSAFVPGPPQGRSPAIPPPRLEVEQRLSPSPLPPCPGVQIQSFQIVESSGLYTLQSVLKAQLAKEDKDAQFYCELSYRLPSGNHMKESPEVMVPVFCEY